MQYVSNPRVLSGLLLCLLAFPQTACFAQSQNEARVLAGQGAFLRGAGSYNLNTAKATSINADTMIRWKQDLRKISAERRELQAVEAAGKKAKIEDVKKRLAQRELELRVNPTAADVDNGQALNALLYDLTDPDITSGDWESKIVRLPAGMSVKDLIFQFMPASSSVNASKALSRGVIALSRLDIEGKWPTAMQQNDLEKERRAFETAYTKLRDQLYYDKFDLKSLLELDRSLESLKSKVETAVPKERGFRDEAVKFVEELKDATRMFDAATVDYATEILIDTKDRNATTVAELVSFMLKYRLQFASAARSPTGRVLYRQLYEVLQQQTKEFGITTSEIAQSKDGAEKAIEDSFQPGTVWDGESKQIIGKDKSTHRVSLVVLERSGEQFKARFEVGKNIVREVSGTIKGDKIAWLEKDVKTIRGPGQGQDHAGFIKGDAIHLVGDGQTKEGKRFSAAIVLKLKKD